MYVHCLRFNLNIISVFSSISSSAVISLSTSPHLSLPSPFPRGSSSLTTSCPSWRWWIDARFNCRFPKLVSSTFWIISSLLIIELFLPWWTRLDLTHSSYPRNHAVGSSRRNRVEAPLTHAPRVTGLRVPRGTPPRFSDLLARDGRGGYGRGRPLVRGEARQGRGRNKYR